MKYGGIGMGCWEMRQCSGLRNITILLQLTQAVFGDRKWPLHCKLNGERLSSFLPKTPAGSNGHPTINLQRMARRFATGGRREAELRVSMVCHAFVCSVFNVFFNRLFS